MSDDNKENPINESSTVKLESGDDNIIEGSIGDVTFEIDIEETERQMAEDKLYPCPDNIDPAKWACKSDDHKKAVLNTINRKGGSE